MPYVFVEELAEGQEAADVVERAQYDQLAAELDTANTNLEAAVDKGVALEAEVKEAKRKYATAFLAKPVEHVAQQPVEVPKTVGSGFDALFGGGM